MIEIPDFTNSQSNFRFYDGSEIKLGITYKENDFILMFSSAPSSEYIVSHLYEFMGITVQETVLGRYRDRIAVACRDFSGNDFYLYEFNKLANAYVGDIELAKDRCIILDEIYRVIENVCKVRYIKEALIKRFWDMFIVDALIANSNRSSSDWGILVPIGSKNMANAQDAPVYDNGWCLNSALTDEEMANILAKRNNVRIKLYLSSSSIFKRKDDNQKINQYSFLQRHENKDADAAFIRLKERIPRAIENINHLIDDIPIITDIRKRFYKESIEYRYRYGILPAL